MTFGEFLISAGWQMLAMAVLLVCSAFFSGSETALFSLSRAELLKFSQSGGRVGAAVESLMARPRRLLMTILLGNQLVNVAFFAVATALMIDLGRAGLAGPWRTILAPMPLILIILFGEVCPKNLAIAKPRSFAKLIAVPLLLLVKVLGPVQKAFSDGVILPLTRLLTPARHDSAALTSEELAELLDLSGRRGVINASESAWLQEVIQLGRRKVADIMVPRVDIVAFDIDGEPTELIERFRQTGLVKIPVYRDNLDDTLGVIYAKELFLTPGKPLASLVRPVPYVPETGTADKLLHQFRKTRTQMAIVVDEYGGTAGLVTLEDALEEIVGDIASENERVVEPVTKISDREYLISGALAVHDWADVFDIDLRAERISTIGGVVMELLDRLPAVGDVARTGNLEFTVEAMRGRRIGVLRLRMLEVGA